MKSVEITNKMQPCNRIYYSKVYWRLSMFRAAHRSSSGALNCICSLFTYTCGDQPLSSLSGKRQFPTQTCWAFNKLWNNKFYYEVVPCWLFLLIHTTMHGSMNIKLLKYIFCPQIAIKLDPRNSWCWQLPYVSFTKLHSFQRKFCRTDPLKLFSSLTNCKSEI